MVWRQLLWLLSLVAGRLASRLERNKGTESELQAAANVSPALSRQPPAACDPKAAPELATIVVWRLCCCFSLAFARRPPGACLSALNS